MKHFTLADAYVTDTVGLILFLENRRMGRRAERIFLAAARSETRVKIPAMVLAEVSYLRQRRRTTAGLDDAGGLLAGHNGFSECPMDLKIIAAAETIVRVTDLHDRLITATALYLNVPLITNDSSIENSGAARTIW